jgi:hypothetical protein
MAEPRTDSDPRKSLSLTFATCCIIDLFGVFPVIALPRAIVECGKTKTLFTLITK